MEDNLLVLDISHVSWAERCMGMWESTTWKIYKDLTTEILDLYGDDEKDKKYVIKLEEHLFKRILKNIEDSKQNDKKNNACDGSAWSIIQYEDGNEIWKRECDYIYGIKPLEEIAKILNNLIKELEG
jgi:hypothetical protein